VHKSGNTDSIHWAPTSYEARNGGDNRVRFWGPSGAFVGTRNLPPNAPESVPDLSPELSPG